MSESVMVTVEGGGSFELSTSVARGLRRGSDCAKAILAEVIRPALPPEPQTEQTDPGCYSGVHRKTGKLEPLFREAVSLPGYLAWMSTEGAWLTWSDVTDLYRDIKRLELARQAISEEGTE